MFDLRDMKVSVKVKRGEGEEAISVLDTVVGLWFNIRHKRRVIDVCGCLLVKEGE